MSDTENTELPDVRPGDRIELIEMPNDPDPIPAGTRGTVVNVVDLNAVGMGWQLWVTWDQSSEGFRRSLMLVPGDRFRKIDSVTVETFGLMRPGDLTSVDRDKLDEHLARLREQDTEFFEVFNLTIPELEEYRALADMGSGWDATQTERLRELMRKLIEPAPEYVYVTVISNRHGDGVYVNRTEDGATTAAYQYVELEWHRIKGDAPYENSDDVIKEIGAYTAGEAIEIWFDLCDDEYCETTRIEVQP